MINSLQDNGKITYTYIAHNNNPSLINFIATIIQSPKLFFAAFLWYAFGEFAIYLGYNTRYHHHHHHHHHRNYYHY